MLKIKKALAEKQFFIQFCVKWEELSKIELYETLSDIQNMKKKKAL